MSRMTPNQRCFNCGHDRDQQLVTKTTHLARWLQDGAASAIDQFATNPSMPATASLNHAAINRDVPWRTISTSRVRA